MRLAEIRFSKEFDPVETLLQHPASLAQPGFRRQTRSSGRCPAFLREPSKGTKAPPVCQGGKPGRNLILTPLPNGCPRPSFFPAGCPGSLAFGDPGDRSGSDAPTSRSANIKEQPANCPRLPQPTRGSLSFRVLQWLVLSRDSLEGLRGVLPTSPEPANEFHYGSLPTSLNSQLERGRPFNFLRFRA